LPEFQIKILSNISQVQNDLGNNTDKFIKSVDKLNNSLTSLKSHLNNAEILSKLNTIEGILNRKNVQARKGLVHSDPDNPPKLKRGFLIRIKNIFRKDKR